LTPQEHGQASSHLPLANPIEQRHRLDCLHSPQRFHLQTGLEIRVAPFISRVAHQFRENGKETVNFFRILRMTFVLTNEYLRF
jgi:protein-disulfide isomerase-like protein with CxxC motif